MRATVSLAASPDAIRRSIEVGEVGVITGESSPGWWRVLLSDGEIDVPEWAIEAV